MNTSKLQVACWDQYTNFFLQNSIVISMPLSSRWTGDSVATYAGGWIQQKVPLRVYCGFSPNDTNNIVLWNVSLYTWEVNGFISKSFEDFSSIARHVKKFIKEIYSSMGEEPFLC